jgi:hypothetical protein
MADSLLADKRFWCNATERSVLTCAQTLAAELAVFQIADVRELGLAGLPWYAMISVAVVAGLISLLSTMAKGSAGSAGSGVELAPEDVGESFAHDDAPLPPDVVSMQLPPTRADKTTPNKTRNPKK